MLSNSCVAVFFALVFCLFAWWLDVVEEEEDDDDEEEEEEEEEEVEEILFAQMNLFFSTGSIMERSTKTLQMRYKSARDTCRASATSGTAKGLC